jgi:hypothetical protein
MTTDSIFMSVPWYDGDTQTWSHKIFHTREHMTAFIWAIFKEPGKYEFDETSFVFNAEARKFQKKKYYCDAVFKSKDYIQYWDVQKERCRKGVIFTSKGKTWYLSRDYYMWLNFLPIYDKEIKDFGFAKVRDAQYHMALYEWLAELMYRHGVILKKRQIASSYFHCAKIINGFWFESGFVGKMGANMKDYINEKGSWRFLKEYANFLDTHTAWYRPRQPDKVFAWFQGIEVTVNGRKQTRGLKSAISGLTFEKDPTNGVGGPCNIFFHEEAGIAPHMDTTYEFIRPALQSGHMTTGFFVAAGSVGDLDQCDPLKKYMLKPMGNGFLGIETNLLNNKGERAVCGLFIPEQWSMPPYIDEYGNSKVEEALAAIIKERLEWKRDLEPEQYQLRISQKPINIEEAFAFRKLSKFPTHLLQAQQKRIEAGEYPYETLDFKRGIDKKIIIEKSNRQPIKEFPVSKTLENKEGVVVVWERPIPNAPWGTYYASIDPVGEGKTTTSESLTSLYIYKAPTEITKVKADGTTEVTVEQGGMVAAWCGRYDDITDTHELLEMVIEWYNAWTIVEVNVSLFIQHMISQHKQKYLVPKDQVIFLKEIQSNGNTHQEYGWKNTGTMFKDHLLNYSIEYTKEEIDKQYDNNGNLTKSVAGVVRIKDPMLIVEMMQYHPGLNVDRLVAFTALVAFVKMQISNRGYKKIVEHTKESLENIQESYKLKVKPFRHVGTGSHASNNPYKVKKSPFKNLR